MVTVHVAEEKYAVKIRTDIEPTRTWIISDTHFGHDNIKHFCHRPEDHTKLMVRQWREAVPDQNSTLLHLGDITYRGKQSFTDIASKLTGERKLLVLGNHDKQPNSFYEDAGFEIIEPFEIALPDYYRISFSHYPWDSRDDGSNHPPKYHYRVHGHIHNNGYGPPPAFPHVPYMLRQINVSVEMLKYRPVKLSDLLNAVLYGELP